VTNEQLSVLLATILERLSAAIDDVRDKLPPEASVTGPDFFGKTTTRYPALSPIEDVLYSIGEHARTLQGKP
jgi:hypothetical protein